MIFTDLETRPKNFLASYAEIIIQKVAFPYKNILASSNIKKCRKVCLVEHTSNAVIKDVKKATLADLI